MPTPEISQPIPDLVPPKTLAEAVERTRLTRTRARDQLQAHRDELLKLRQRGESVEGLIRALAEFGIVVGNETLRIWFQHELGLRRKRRRAKPVTAAIPAAPSPETVKHALDAARAYAPGESAAAEDPSSSLASPMESAPPP